MNGAAREVTFRIRRFEPGRDEAPHWDEHKILAPPGLTVLDGIWKIKEESAPTLAWRSSCRMGICGSCGMLINGRPRLACNTQIADLGDLVTVAPLPNFDIIRDLVPDLQPMFVTHREMKPFLIRDDVAEQEQPTAAYVQSPEEQQRYLQFSYCIKCGCCMAACPTLATDTVYAGPMPLSQAMRYTNESRDAGFAARLGVLSGERGPWSCHYAGECSQVCPKGVDPGKAIQLLKRELMKDLLGVRRKRAPAVLAQKRTGVTPKAEIPKAPAPTI